MTKETAMKILKELHDKSLFAERTAIETIIPELNEDEKIRNALIRFHKSTIDVDGIKGADILAWLEKQGSQQPTIIWHSVSEEPEEMKELFCEWESDDATWHDVAFYDEESKTFRHAKMPINVTKWVYVDELLERQGEQKPFDYEKATITQKDFAPEQEPKFKVGDWVRLMTLDEIRNTEGVVCKRNERGEDMFLNRNYHAKVWIHFGEWLLPYLGKSFVIEKILGDCVEVPHNICYLQDWLFVKVE